MSSLVKEPIVELADMSDFEQLIRQHPDKTIILDFFATWCGPCKAIAPLFKELASQHKSVIFCKVDVDEAEEICSKYDINVMPTFVFTKNGEAVDRIEGGDEEELKRLVQKHVAQ